LPPICAYWPRLPETDSAWSASCACPRSRRTRRRAARPSRPSSRAAERGDAALTEREQRARDAALAQDPGQAIQRVALRDAAEVERRALDRELDGLRRGVHRDDLRADARARGGEHVRGRRDAAARGHDPEHDDRPDRDVEHARGLAPELERARRQLDQLGRDAQRRAARRAVQPGEVALHVEARDHALEPRDLREQLAQQRLAFGALARAQVDLQHRAHLVLAVGDARGADPRGIFERRARAGAGRCERERRQARPRARAHSSPLR
jgi:hypothetical protein